MSGKLSESALKIIKSADADCTDDMLSDGVVGTIAGDRRDLLGHVDALAAENERLTRELQSIKSIIFGGPMPDGFELTGIVEEVRQGVIAHDRAKRKAESDADDEAAARRVAEKELAAAQQRLAALAVNPAKREAPQRGLTGPKLPTEFFVCYSAVSREVEKTFLSIEAAMQWADRYGDGGFVIHCTAGRLSRGAEINMLETVAGAANQKVAELQRQLAEARKWEGQYRRLYENCDASHEKTLKQLAELTKPANEIELRKIAWANYGAIYAQQKGEPLEPYESSTPERRARIDKAADAVAARVRAPLLEQIAELNDKLEEAEKQLARTESNLEAQLARREHLDDLLDTTHRRVLAAGVKFERDRDRSIVVNVAADEAKADRDRLAAELATTQQSLADARGEVERVRAACEPFKAYADEIPAAMPEDYLLVPHELTVREWRELRGAIEPVQSSAPANPPASEPVGLCPKCGIQPLTKEGDDMIRLGEKDYLCGNCKRYLCRPIESKAAASVPDDSSHTPDTAHTSSSQSEPASVWIRGQQYSWKFNGATPYLELPFALTAEEARGLYANLQVAEATKPADHSGDANEKVEPAERRFVCPECGNTKLYPRNNPARFEEPLMCQNLKCMRESTWAEVEAAKDGPITAATTDIRKIVEKSNATAAANQAREAAAERWQAKVLELERRCNDEHFKCEAAEQRAAAAEGREAALQSKLNDLEASRKVLKRDAEAAEAAVGALKDTIKRVCFVGPADGRVCSSCGSCFSPHSPQCEVGKALATDPGRMLDELRAGKALAGKIRDALCSVEAIAHVERALADYDQAISQGERTKGESHAV